MELLPVHVLAVGFSRSSDNPAGLPGEHVIFTVGAPSTGYTCSLEILRNGTLVADVTDGGKGTEAAVPVTIKGPPFQGSPSDAKVYCEAAG